MNRDDYIEMLAALVELASSVGDAVFAGVSMDAAVAYSRLRRRRAGGEATARHVRAGIVARWRTLSWFVGLVSLTFCSSDPHLHLIM